MCVTRFIDQACLVSAKVFCITYSLFIKNDELLFHCVVSPPHSIFLMVFKMWWVQIQLQNQQKVVRTCPTR